MQQRHFLSIYSTTATVIRRLPHPRRLKAESQAYSHCKSDHTATITPLYISKSHGLQALGYTMWGRVRRWHNRDVNCPVVSSESYTVVLIMHVAVQFDLLFYMSHSGVCNEK